MDINKNMEQRINLEKQNKRNDQITELILDNCRASQITGLTDEFVNLETLSLINVGLVTLKGFPKLPKLKKLELSDNRLTGGLNLLHGSSKLQHLNISGNRIKDLEALEPLKEFHDLANLDLYNCEVTKLDDYRQKVFDLLPNLHSLDGYDFNEREVADDEDSEDEVSDAENCITRDDNDLDEDDEDDDEEEDEEDDESSEYAEEDLTDMINSGNDYLNADHDDEEGEDDDDDEDDEEEDDDEEDGGVEDKEGENWAANEAQAGGVSKADGHNSRSDEVSASSVEEGPAAVSATEVTANEDDCLGSVVNVENGEEDGEEEGEDGIDDEEEEEEGNEDGDGSDLKQLQKDIGEDEDSDDDDFEPSHEPDERDYEIDPEDDADEEESSALLSTSNLDATASSEAEDSKLRGQKRKHEPEDEGGDEVGED